MEGPFFKECSNWLSGANCGHDPSKYLKDVLLRLPDQPLNCLDELLPHNWEPLREGLAQGTLLPGP